MNSDALQRKLNDAFARTWDRNNPSKHVSECTDSRLRQEEGAALYEARQKAMARDKELLKQFEASKTSSPPSS
jgi:hypothetical protein